MKSTFRLDPPGFSSDTTVDVALDRTIVTVAYGATADIDLGVVLPFGRARVTGRTAYQRLNEPVPYRYSAEADGSSMRLGDVILRAKAGLPSTEHTALAVVSDTHLPIGETDQLLGTGKLQEKLMFIGEMPFGKLTPHVNVGYLFGGNGIGVRPFEVVPGIFVDQLTEPEPSPEFDYTIGAEHAASASLTIAGDVIGRVLRRSLVVDFWSDNLGSKFFTFKPGTIHLLLGAIGGKLKVGGQSLITASVLFPLNGGGVKPAVTPVIGFERAF